MKRVVFILAAVVMAFVMTSCNESVGMDESAVKGKWQSDINNVTMTLVFGEKTVEYIHHIESYDAQATYKGSYKVNDKTITLHFYSIQTKNATKPIVRYTEPEQMPTDALLSDDDSEIMYLNQTFKRVNCQEKNIPF